MCAFIQICKTCLCDAWLAVISSCTVLLSLIFQFNIAFLDKDEGGPEYYSRENTGSSDEEDLHIVWDLANVQ